MADEDQTQPGEDLDGEIDALLGEMERATNELRDRLEEPDQEPEQEAGEQPADQPMAAEALSTEPEAESTPEAEPEPEEEPDEEFSQEDIERIAPASDKTLTKGGLDEQLSSLLGDGSTPPPAPENAEAEAEDDLADGSFDDIAGEIESLDEEIEQEAVAAVEAEVDALGDDSELTAPDTELEGDFEEPIEALAEATEDASEEAVEASVDPDAETDTEPEGEFDAPEELDEPAAAEESHPKPKTARAAALSVLDELTDTPEAENADDSEEFDGDFEDATGNVASASVDDSSSVPEPEPAAEAEPEIAAEVEPATPPSPEPASQPVAAETTPSASPAVVTSAPQAAESNTHDVVAKTPAKKTDPRKKLPKIDPKKVWAKLEPVIMQNGLKAAEAMSKPLQKKPVAVRDAAGWIALNTVVLAVGVWGWLLFFRQPPAPQGSGEPTVGLVSNDGVPIEGTDEQGG